MPCPVTAKLEGLLTEISWFLSQNLWQYLHCSHPSLKNQCKQSDYLLQNFYQDFNVLLLPILWFTLTDILVLLNIYKTTKFYIRYYFSYSLTETLWLWKLVGIFLKPPSPSLISTFPSHILKTKIASTQSSLPINLHIGTHHKGIATIFSIFYP